MNKNAPAVAVDESSSVSDRRTLLVWIGLCLLAFPIAGELGHLIAGHVDDVGSALLGGAITGAGIGVAQWFVLRRRMDVGPEWIAGTATGLAVGLAAGASVVDYGTTTIELAIMGAISGIFVGLAQGVVLREGLPRWVVWAIAMPGLWALGWVVTDVTGIRVEEQFIVFGLFGTIAYSALSGVLLVSLMRRRRLRQVTAQQG